MNDKTEPLSTVAVDPLVMREHDHVIIDWEVCDGNCVTREFDDPARLGYVIAQIPHGLQEFVEQMLPEIDAEYDAKAKRIGKAEPLTGDEIDAMILARF